MTVEVLSQLKSLRGGLADTVQGDPRYLTLNALDRSVAEITAVASASNGDAGAVPSQVLAQLKTIRDGIADGLRNDHRYLTLNALDKSIAEIGGMLASAGLIAPEHAAPMAPVHFEPGAPAAAAASTPAPAPAEVAATPTAVTPAEPAPKSNLKPMLETAAVIGAGLLAAEVIGGEGKPAKAAKAKPKPEAADAASDEHDEGEHHETEEHETDGAEAETKAAKSKKADDAEEPEASDDVEDAGDEADADETKNHGDHEAKPEHADGDDAETATTDDGEADDAEAEAEEHDAKKHGEDSEKHDESEKSDEAEAPGGEADKDGDNKGAGADAGMPDAAGIVPKGKASGYVPMAARAGAPQYQPGTSVKFFKLPNKVDLRPLMTPIEDQGETSSCVANAVAGAYEYWIKKASKQDQNISRLFVYYNARWRDGSQDKDDGSVIQLAMEGLQKFGACPETVWPFDPRLVTKKPGGEAYKDAAPYRVQDMAQVPLKLDAWKQALAEGKPIVFGCALFDSFDECSKRGGVVPMPSPDDVARAKHSGHSMCAVGYSDIEKVFIVRNSWGADWGDKGYCYMPYDYLLNEKFNDGDCWVFVPKVPMQPPREVWSNTTEPVTNSGQGVDFPIATFTIADYEHIAVDLFEKIRKPFNDTILEDYGQYVSLASKSLWSEFDSFDFKTFLASTAALAGVAGLATEAFASVTNESHTESSESLDSSEESESESESDESEEDESPEDSDESDEDSDDEDSDEDDAEDDEDSDESDEDDDSDSDDDADDAENGEDSDDGESEGDEDSDGDDADEDDDAAEDDAEDDDDSEDDDDDSDEDDSDEDDGGDEGGGDDEGGDDDDE